MVRQELADNGFVGDRAIRNMKLFLCGALKTSGGADKDESHSGTGVDRLDPPLHLL